MSDHQEAERPNQTSVAAPGCVDPYHLLLSDLVQPVDELDYLETLRLIRFGQMLERIKGKKIPAQ